MCSGFPAQDGIVFRHETAATLNNVPPRRSSFANHRSGDGTSARTRELSTPLEDRAIAFLINNYVFNVAPGVENHVYLPRLLQQCHSSALIRTVATATGLSALANAGNSPHWRSQGYRLYGHAVRQLQVELSQSCITNTDEILGSISLLATFEVRGIISTPLGAIPTPCDEAD